MNLTRRNFIKGTVGTLAMTGISMVLPACNINEKTKSGLKIADFSSKGTASINSVFQNSYTANVPTELIVLNNKSGMEACITNFGARIVSLMAPDKNGEFRDVELGFDNIKDYVDIDNKNNVFGAVVGPVIGRISNAQFTCDGKIYNIEKNYKDIHNIHSAKFGWHYQTWTVKEKETNSVTLNLVCPDMENGFPGKRNVEVTYTLTDDNGLQIDYLVSTDKPTPINVSNHSYFNLEGNPNNDCYNNEIQIFSNKYLCVGDYIIPTGEIKTFEQGSVYDFNSLSKTMIENKDINNEAFKYTKGFDFAYILNKNSNINAKVYCPESGILMEVITDRPIINFYDAHDLDGSFAGKSNILYNKCCGICLEAQGYTDGVNHPNFENTIITPDKPFSSTTTYKFSIK